MPRQFNPPYTVGFVAVVSVVCALLLSSAATVLKPLQDANQQFDIRRNIIKAFGEKLENPGPEAVNAFFEARIKGVVINAKGETLDGQSAEKVNPEDEEKKPAGERRYPAFVLLDEAGAPAAYAVPIIGKGLWSTLYGYLAVNNDLNTVRGITFYKHGETPGLGAEISEPWFQANFTGKKLYDEQGSFASIKVIKGKVSDAFPEGNDHAVDGISGATMTANGVTALLRDDLGTYLKLLKTFKLN